MLKRLWGRITRSAPTVIDEHFVPQYGDDLGPYLERGDIGAVHHLIRYQWALRMLADQPAPRTVLDVACGAGYGAFGVARAFPEARVIGADYDEAAVAYARQHYQLPNLEFRIGDVARWRETIGQGLFDCIISFDTIEHVQHRELMMESVVLALRDTGALLFSTPCGADFNNLQPDWHHHHIEYSTASLYDFLRRYFGVVRRSDLADFPHRDVFDRLREGSVGYLLRLNPVLCTAPLRVDNPYRPR